MNIYVISLLTLIVSKAACVRSLRFRERDPGKKLLEAETESEFSESSSNRNLISQDETLTLDIYPDATIDVQPCDGENGYLPLEQGEKLCLQFSVSEDGLEVIDIDELEIVINEHNFGWIAIHGGDETDKGIVEKNCLNGECTVEILMFTNIFEFIPDDVNSATLEIEGRAIINNGEFDFEVISQDVSVTLEIYPDATIDVQPCDGENGYLPLEQGEKLCLQFSVSENGLEVTDIDELEIGMIEYNFGWIAIQGGDEIDKGIVEKNCLNGECTVEILMFTDIFEFIPDDVNLATLEIEGRAIISRSGKNYDATTSDEFDISLTLWKSECECDEELNPLSDGAGELLSLVIAINLNL